MGSHSGASSALTDPRYLTSVGFVGLLVLLAVVTIIRVVNGCQISREGMKGQYCRWGVSGVGGTCWYTVSWVLSVFTPAEKNIAADLEQTVLSLHVAACCEPPGRF